MFYHYNKKIIFLHNNILFRNMFIDHSLFRIYYSTGHLAQFELKWAINRKPATGWSVFGILNKSF